MLVQVKLHVVLVAFGNRDELVSEDNATSFDSRNEGHVDNETAVYALELRLGEIILEFLHVHEAHDLLPVLQVETYIVLEAFDEEDVVEPYAHEFVVALDEQETVVLHVLLAQHQGEVAEA